VSAISVALLRRQRLNDTDRITARQLNLRVLAVKARSC
jgi:hypothetical protein